MEEERYCEECGVLLFPEEEYICDDCDAEFSSSLYDVFLDDPYLEERDLLGWGKGD